MINFKNLGKALKYSNFSSVAWFRTEKYSYLFTGYWGIRTTKQLHIEKGIFVNLINLFQAIPEAGKGYEIRNMYQGPVPIDEERIKFLVELLENKPKNEIKYTSLMNIRSLQNDIIFKSESDYIFVNKVYADIVDIADYTKLYGSGPNQPIYTQDNEEIAMILPVRYQNIPEYLKSN